MGIILVATIPGIYISCGGDGGSSGAPAAEPAVLNQETVDKVVNMVDDTVPFCSMTASTASMTDALYAVVEIAQDIGDQTRLMKISKDSAGAAVETMADDDTVIDGNCGGQIILSMVQDEVAGTISGGIDFDSYCASLDDDTELNVNGEATISGSTQTLANDNEKIVLQLDTHTPITIQQGEDLLTLDISNAALTLTQGTGSTALTLTLSEAVFTDGNESYTLGNVSITVSVTDGEPNDQIVIDVDSFQLDEVTSEGSVTHQLSNVSISVTSGVAETTISVGGTYTNSDEGAVTLSTPAYITVSSEGEIVSGTIVASGAQGTRISMVASGGNQFLIQADTDGDGSYDYQPGTMDCSAFDADTLF